MRFIIDTDMGIDDAVALFMILAHPQARVEALTTVVGNVSLAQATHNAGMVLDVAQAPALPIFQGCARPLLQYSPKNAVSIFGPDGLGGAGRPETSRPVEPEHAALALIRLARQRPGQVTLLTLGPLTNVALAIRLDPHFLTNLKRVVMMGGAVDGRGNTSPPAEFNVAVDPEAATIVFEACSRARRQPQLISWETTLASGIPPVDWDKIIGGQSAIAAFVQQMTVHLKQVLVAVNGPELLWPDPLAAAVALVPDIVINQEPRFIAVEYGHNLARGQTIVDYRPASESTPNAQIVRAVNLQRFKELLRLAVQA
jgi:purine nucleosidase